MKVAFPNHIDFVLFCTAVGIVLPACVSKDFDETMKLKSVQTAVVSAETKAATSVPESERTGVCPLGTRFNSFPRVCVTRGGFALGPFPLELQEVCRKKSPDDAATCVQRQDWPFELLMTLVDTYQEGCPPGTSPGRNGVCVGADNIYGPFTLQQIMSCRADVPPVQQKMCDEIVWPPDFLKYAEDTAPLAKKAVTSPEEKADKNTSEKKESASEGAPVKEPTSSPTVADAAQKSAEDGPQTLQPPIEKKALIKVPLAGEDETPKSPTFCVYSWDERPGTADLTTINGRLASLNQPQVYALDRNEESTLLGNRDFHNLDVCGRARFLKGCFQRVVYDSNFPAAQIFRAWSMGRVRPVEAHMAFVMNETRLGLWRDECWRGRCKGVGIARVVRARTVAGKALSHDDVAWQGITHNILTNLQYGLREIAAKAAQGPSDLYQLAYTVYGKPGQQERAAQSVEKYYRQILACQLD